MAKKTKQKETTCDLLDCIEQIINKSKDSKMSEALLKDKNVKILARQMQVTERQAVIFSLCMHYGPINTMLSELSSHLSISKVRVLHYCEDIDDLVRRNLLRYRDNEQMSFDIPFPVINELKHNRVFTPPSNEGIDTYELFSRFDTLFSELKDDILKPERLTKEVEELLEKNPDLDFVRNLRDLKLDDEEDLMLLVFFCHYCVNDGDNNILFSDIDDLYEHSSHFMVVRNLMRQGTHPLMQRNLIEFVCEDGQACTSRFKLTDKAKNKLLSEFNLTQTEERVAGLIDPSSVAAKPMFYSPNLERRVDELTHFVENEEFQKICDRMKEKGFHNGLACLFYGSPGTGKTETVYQIARKTGRGIFLVDIPQIKSKWVGDSEKNIQAVFMQYREMVKKLPVAPILVFNEADAILGSRMNGAMNAVDKMENAIQNIILQEMENLDGILIATTNLEGNLDPAFERRFLYKIKFEKPNAQVRQNIWQAMMPQLSHADAAILAKDYMFSGSQIENVARKLTVYEILHGEPENYLAMLRTYCNEEGLQKGVGRKCGFV